MRIGLFDSGLGGLTILRAVAEMMPVYDYRYYGDTKHLPYGDKSEEGVYELTKEGVSNLFSSGCSLVVIACNTASAATVRALQDTFMPEHYLDKKLLGIIVPTVETIIASRQSRVLLLATKRTVEAGKYEIELRKQAPSDVRLQAVATPQLVPLIERGDLSAAATQAIAVIKQEDRGSGVVVLGCSHYTEIKQQLREHFQDTKRIISQDEVVPVKLQEYLKAHPEIERRLSCNGTRSVHLTEHSPRYDQIIGQLLGKGMSEPASKQAPENSITSHNISFATKHP